MKKFLYRAFCCLLSGVIFLASTGFGLVEESCLVRGRAVSVLSPMQTTPARPCCGGSAEVPTPRTAGTTVKKEPCCGNQAQYQHVEAQTTLVQVMAHFLVGLGALLLDACANLFHALFDLFQSAVLATIPAPPPPSGRDVLTWLQIFRI